MKPKDLVIPIIISLFIVLSACSPEPEFEVYEGKVLSIAVIGDPPTINEEQVKFNEISFDDLTEEDLKFYDAVFITNEYLSKASESQYADVYMNSAIPMFFISAKNHIPFTEKDTEYNESWEWTPGNSYAVGVLNHQENDSLNSWKFGIYNGENTEAHIREMYSRIFKTVDEQGL
ncbi:hypothetical protein FZC78_06370 [Rossellomorea vietnamensis]|uniref:Lipoprotein n=1 Tax=Rossellomorea vietnamensis TaxID=218284 RepID=A0A5D4NUZ5_9BACI|nr:hypothetical protein [Rossellomorea vietnamensis]TYS17501.1 hypothetical protein FZC78_06370 [Rossellomorea vietnamensis]